MNQSYKRIIWIIVSAIIIFGGFFLAHKIYSYIKRINQKPLEEATITIPEGFTILQMGEAFQRAGLFSKNDFIKAAAVDEGFLFPDTYRLYKNSTPQQVVAKMQGNFNKKITPDILSIVAGQKKTLNDIIKMASILEEEASSTADRKIISGILWKRIDLGIPLQVDSATSTYLYKELPVAPISNPGMDAIFAAIYPTKSSYLFYLSDKSGKIHYAKTFEEHKLNKYKYLK